MNHTAFQLQLVDPIPDENKILIENTDVNSCSQLCCDHENCDVALFADEVSKGCFANFFYSSIHKTRNSSSHEQFFIFMKNCIFVSELCFG